MAKNYQAKTLQKKKKQRHKNISQAFKTTFDLSTLSDPEGKRMQSW
jgi:hypothetical protein